MATRTAGVNEKPESDGVVRLRCLAALLLVVVSTCSTTLVSSYSRLQSGPKYLASTAVLVSNLVKVPIILAILAGTYGWRNVRSTVRDGVLGPDSQTLLFAVPAALFTLEDFLWLFALTYVGATMVTVAGQLKVPSTATFSMLLLGRKITGLQWLAIVSVMGGLVAMQIEVNGTGMTLLPAGPVYYAGLSAMLVVALCSGYSSVYLERLLKVPSSDIWVRNIQLLVFQLPVSVAAVVWDVWANGCGIRDLLQGWSWLVLLVCLLNAVGGFAAGLAMRYADNILKTFATSISTAIVCVLSAAFLAERLSREDVAGVCLVLVGTALYATRGAPDEPTDAPTTERGDLEEADFLLQHGEATHRGDKVAAVPRLQL